MSPMLRSDRNGCPPHRWEWGNVCLDCGWTRGRDVAQRRRERDYRRGAADALRAARERVEALPNTSGGHWDTTWNDATGTTDHYHECHGLDRAAVLAALAQPAPAAPTYTVVERLDHPGNRANLQPAPAAPLDEGITQRAHVPCCWCREHHEEGAI